MQLDLKRIIKYCISLFGSAVIDLGLFTVLTNVLSGKSAQVIMLATVVARCASGVFNFTANKNWCFASRGNNRRQIVQFSILFVTQMLLSGGLVNLIRFLPFSLTLIKLIVDSYLNVPAFLIQQNIIFKDRDITSDQDQVDESSYQDQICKSKMK